MEGRWRSSGSKERESRTGVSLFMLDIVRDLPREYCRRVVSPSDDTCVFQVPGSTSRVEYQSGSLIAKFIGIGVYLQISEEDILLRRMDIVVNL